MGPEDGHKAAANCKDLTEPWEGSARPVGASPCQTCYPQFIRNHTRSPSLPGCVLSLTWNCPGPTSEITSLRECFLLWNSGLGGPLCDHHNCPRGSCGARHTVLGTPILPRCLCSTSSFLRTDRLTHRWSPHTIKKRTESTLHTREEKDDDVQGTAGTSALQSDLPKRLSATRINVNPCC